MTIDAVTDLQSVLVWLEMYIGGPIHDGSLNDLVDESDNRRILILKIVLGFLIGFRIQVGIIQTIGSDSEVLGDCAGNLFR